MMGFHFEAPILEPGFKGCMCAVLEPFSVRSVCTVITGKLISAISAALLAVLCVWRRIVRLLI